MSTPEHREGKLQKEIDRLTRLCEAKDAELEQKTACLRAYSLDITEYLRQLSEAQAQIAMKDAALKECRTFIKCEEIPSREALEAIETALSSTSETVAAWRAKETEPYKREVAMMRWEIEKCLTHIHPVNRPASAVRASRNSEAAALAYEREVKEKAQAPLQAQIDRLMLEYCPDEITTEQIENWAKHQIPVDEKTQALIDRAANKGEVK